MKSYRFNYKSIYLSNISFKESSYIEKAPIVVVLQCKSQNQVNYLSKGQHYFPFTLLI